MLNKFSLNVAFFNRILLAEILQFVYISQVMVLETDQIWIYGNYTCKANNELGTNDIIIELERASK